MSTALWIVAIIIVIAAFCESATSGILAVLGIGAFVFLWFALWGENDI